MPNHRIKLPEDEIVRLYVRDRRSVRSIAVDFGVSEVPIRRVLREAGVPKSPRRIYARRHAIQTDELRRLYCDEMWSVKRLSEKYGVTRLVIDRRLDEMGIQRRGRAQAQRVVWDGRSPEQRLAHLAAPHAAVTGRVPTEAERIKTARTRQRRRTHTSPVENQLRDALRHHGLDATPQLAIGRYNCDLALDPVAVEVWGGHWHFHGDHRRRSQERIPYLLGRGWHVYILPVTANDPLTKERVCDLVSYIQGARRNPSAPREYRVVWRAGEWERVGTPEDDKVLIDPPFRAGHDPATGEYKRVPR